MKNKHIQNDFHTYQTLYLVARRHHYNDKHDQKRAWTIMSPTLYPVKLKLGLTYITLSSLYPV